MPENSNCCLWWDCYVCKKEICNEKCDVYFDARTEEGHLLADNIQKEFDDACEVVREKYRKDLGL